MTKAQPSFIALFAIISLVGFGFAMGRNINTYTDEQGEASAKFVAEECAKVGGTYAQGFAVGNKDMATMSLCILNKKGIGI